MTEADEAEFVEYLHSLAETRLEPECLDHPVAPDPGLPGASLPSGTFGCWLWRPGKDPPPVRSELAGHCVEAQSQAIEFTRTGYCPERLSAGRLWIDTYDPRPDEFLKWYGQLVRWIRKRYRRDRFGVYWGPGAQRRWVDRLEPRL